MFSVMILNCGRLRGGKFGETNLLPLSKLLKHRESLLNNYNVHGVAHFLALDHGLATVEAVEVVLT